MTAKKLPRRVQPENWNDIHAYAAALKRFAETRDPNEFTEFHIPHEAMAKALHEIALGADAREVFRQAGRTGRQSLRTFHRTLAFVFWRARANGQHERDAIGAAGMHFEDFPFPSEDSFLRIARRYRKFAFEALKKQGVDVSALEKQSNAKAHRGSWE